MRIYKIVSFSVVTLFITVLFAGVVAVPAAAQSATTSDLSGGAPIWYLYPCPWKFDAGSGHSRDDRSDE
jgi:hypothetical protein